MMRKNLLIIAQARTGSTMFGQMFGEYYLGEILESYKDFICDNPDKFHDIIVDKFKEKNWGVLKILVRDATPYIHHITCGNDIWDKIILIRKNIMGNTLSQYLAYSSRVYHIKEKNERGKNKIKIDMDVFGIHLFNTFKVSKFLSFLSSAYNIPLYYYEDIYDGEKINNKLVDKIRETYGLGPLKEEIPIIKLSDEDYYKEVIENYDEAINKYGELYGNPFKQDTPKIWEIKENLSISNYFNPITFDEA